MSPTGLARRPFPADHFQYDFGFEFTAVISLLASHVHCPLWTLAYARLALSYFWGSLHSLSPEAKDALIIALWEEVLRMRERLSKLERPKKTSKNSSKRPSEGFKPNKPSRGKGAE
ncbi:MAG: hypothetical protein AAFQ23_13500, partial [Cyanobacteria bacterium J06623_1]